MTNRTTRYLLTGGAAVMAVMMLLVVLSGFRRLATSNRAEGSASGSSKDFMSSTNKVALARELATHGDVSAVSGLVLGLRTDSDPAVRAGCAEALGKIGDRRSMPDLALRLIEDTDPAVRRVVVLAFEACGMHRDFGFYDTLKKRLSDDKAPEVRREIVGVLRRLGTDDAMNSLAAAAGDTDPGVRLAAVRAFAESKHEAAGQVLSQAALDPDVAVQGEAAAALHRAGTLLLPQLREAVAGARDGASRMAAIRLLPRPVVPEALPILFTALEKETADSVKRSPLLHNAVVDAIVSMGPKGAAAIAKEAIGEEYAGTAERAAAQACLRIGKPAAKPIVEEIMRWHIFPDPAELAIWVETLGEIGDPCAVPVLRRALAQGLSEMPAIVEKARSAIEAKSGSPLPAIVPEPGLLADAPSGPIRRFREGDMRFANVKPTLTTIPSNGVMRLRLVKGMAWPDPVKNPDRSDLGVEVVIRDGVWDKRLLIAGCNKRDHEGILLDVRETATERTFVFDGLFYDDSWRQTAFGHFEIVQPFAARPFSGTYTGHMNFRPVTGIVEGVAYELPPHPPALPPLVSGEHPRLLFRDSDIAMLREKARTDFGKRVIGSLRRSMAAEKTLYRTPLNWVGNWEPGCHMAIGQGFMAMLFDDPLYGRRSAPLIIDRTRTPPYGGEHGERMPGPMSHYPYAVDMNCRYLTAEERKEVVESRCWIPSLYNQAVGPLAVMAVGKGLFGITGMAALTMSREKGAFSMRQPDFAPEVITLPGVASLNADNAIDPVNLFLSGSMPSNWLVAGPFQVEDGVDALAPIGGCEAAKPQLDTPVPVAGGLRKFRPLALSAIQTMPAVFPRAQFVELPPVTPGEQFFLYAVLKVETRQGALVDPSSPGGARWHAIWVDGHAMSGGAMVVLEPGLHRVLVCARSSYCSPTFTVADTEWSMAKRRRYELLNRRYEEARKRSVETGEMEDVAIVFELIRQSVRDGLWWDTNAALAGNRRRGVIGPNAQFVLACRSATGRGLDPDIPRPLLLPGESLGDVGGSLDMVATDTDLVYMLGYAPEAILPDVVGEFDRRITPERFARLSPLEQIVAFVNYPLDVKGRAAEKPLVAESGGLRNGGQTKPPLSVDLAVNDPAVHPPQKSEERVNTTSAGIVPVVAPIVFPAPTGRTTVVGFRNNGTGHYQGKVVDKFDLTTGVNIRWKVALPDYGVSSPIVVRPDPPGTNGDLVIVTCDPDRVIAYRLADGKEVWNRGIGVAALLNPTQDAALRDIGKWSGALSSYPSYIIPQVRRLSEKDPESDWTPEPGLGWSVATPVSDGSNVWAVGYRGAVGCVGLDGELKWKTFVSRPNVVGEKGAWGDWLPGTIKGSPCLVDGRLIVTSLKTVFALDPASGTNLWRTKMPPAPGKSNKQGFRGSTPTVWRHQDRSILVWGQGYAMDAKDGANVSGIWPEIINNTPCLVTGDRMIARFSRGRRGDAPPLDGEPPTPWQLFAWDLSLVDGKLNLRRAWACPPDHRFMQNAPNGNATAGLTQVGDMVVGCVLDEGAVPGKGLLVAKLADGAAQDAGCAVGGTSRPSGNLSFWQPSPSVAGDRMVVADKDGTVTIVDIAQFPWKVVSRTSVATPENRGKAGFVIGASPCIAGDALLIRTSRELICVGQK